MTLSTTLQYGLSKRETAPGVEASATEHIYNVSLPGHIVRKQLTYLKNTELGANKTEDY